MMDRHILLSTTEGITMLVLMNRRSFLGCRPMMASMTLYPKDPNVEQRGLGSMTQTTKEEKLIDFVAREKKKKGSGRSISQILKHLEKAYSTKILTIELQMKEVRVLLQR